MECGKATGLRSVFPDGRFLIGKQSLRDDPVEGRFWPKVAFRQDRKSVGLCDSYEGPESTRGGHSSESARTSVVGSQSSRSYAEISQAVDSQGNFEHLRIELLIHDKRPIDVRGRALGKLGRKQDCNKSD